MSRAEEISRRVATEVRLSKTGDFTNYATGLCQSGPMSEEGQDIAEYAVMGAYSASRPETGLLIPSVFVSHREA